MFDKIWFYIKDFTLIFASDCSKMLLRIIIIITIIMVVIEILKALKVLDFINKILYFIFKPLGISKNASMPLLIGMITGLTYGAGAIISSYENHELTKKDLILVGTFLMLCHAVVEDTLLFSAEGAKGWLIILIRFGLAIIATLIANLLYNPKTDFIEGETNE